MKRIVSFLLGITMFLLCACADGAADAERMGEAAPLPQQENAVLLEEAPPDLRLRRISLPLPGGMTVAQGQVLINRRVFSFSNEDGPSLGYTDLNGDTELLELPEGLEYIHAACPAEDKLAVLAGTYPTVYDTPDGETVFQEAPEGRLTLLLYEESGALVKTVPLQEQYHTAQEDIYDMACWDGVFVLMCRQQLIALDESGREAARQTQEGRYYGQIDAWDGGIVACLGDGFSVGDEVRLVDPLTLEDTDVLLQQKWTLSGTGQAADGALLLNSMDGQVWRLDQETGALTIVLDWQENAGTLSQSYQHIVEYEDGYFALGGGQEAVNCYVRTEEATEPVELTLGVLGWCDAYARVVNEFNQSSQDYYITPVIYQNDDDLERARVEMIAGNGCDLYAFGLDHPMRELQSAGIFEDLLPWLDSDQEVGRDTLIPSLLSAYLEDGALYRMPYCFWLETYLTTESAVKETGRSMAQLNAAAEGTAFPQVLPAWMTQSELLQHMSESAVFGYIDPETGEAHFTDADFLCLLEACKSTEPLQTDPETFYDWGFLWYEDLQSMSRLGYLHNLWEDYIFVGGPCLYGNGSMFDPVLEFAMYAQSAHKDGAWEFLRFSLNETNQARLSTYFPVHQAVLQQALDTAEEKQQITESDRIKFLQLVEQTTAVKGRNGILSSIIYEEAAEFCAGSQTALQAADHIQSRVELYFAEQG